MIDFFQVKQRALILAPHADDEILGCGGSIQKWIERGCAVRIVITTLNLSETKRYHKEADGYSLYSGKKRISELKDAMDSLGVTDYHILYPDRSGKQLYDSKLDTIPRAELVSRIERHIEDFRPTVLYIPSITKHQDHEALHRAAIAAARPYFWDGTILVYETDGEIDFQPNLYITLTEQEIARKMKALESYKTQVITKRHPVHPDSLLHKARFRGSIIYEEFAEAFQIIRMKG